MGGSCLTVCRMEILLNKKKTRLIHAVLILSAFSLHLYA